MSDPVRVRRGSKKEFTRVSVLLDSKITSLMARMDVLESRVKKLEEKKPRKRKKTSEKPK